MLLEASIPECENAVPPNYIERQDMNRLQWIEKRYGDQINALLKGSGSKATAKAVIERFASFDPSRNKKYTQWVVKTFVNEGLLLDDGTKVEETLGLFIKHFRAIPANKRDINVHATLPDLWDTVAPFVGVTAEELTPSGKEIRRQERKSAYDDSIILADNDDWTVAIPLTDKAAKWWGRGTRWCTTNGSFWNYHREAPLIVIVMADGSKYQAHIYGKNSQFRNSLDRTIHPSDVKKHWKLMGNLVKRLFTEKMKYLEIIPPKFITREMAVAAVEHDGNNIARIPAKYVTIKLCIAAYKLGCDRHFLGWRFPKSVLSIEYLKRKGVDPVDLYSAMPKSEWTPEYAVGVGRKYAYSFREIPKRFQTDKVAEAAVRSHPRSWKSIPKKFMTEDFFIAVVETDPEVFYELPEELRTPKVIYAALDKLPAILRYLPLDTSFITRAQWEALVEKHGSVIRHVPKRYLNRKLYMSAFKSDIRSIEHIPTKYISKNMILRAAMVEPSILDFNSVRMTSHFTRSLCRHVASVSSTALWYIPNKFLSREMILSGLEDGGFSLEGLPEEQIDLEMCRVACKANHSNYNCVPTHLLCDELHNIAYPPEQNEIIPPEFETRSDDLPWAEYMKETTGKDWRANEEYMASIRELFSDEAA